MQLSITRVNALLYLTHFTIIPLHEQAFSIIYGWPARVKSKSVIFAAKLSELILVTNNYIDKTLERPKVLFSA